MLHVVTVHFHTDRWIEPQLRYLRRFTPPDTQIWASLDGIEPGRGFEHETTLEGTHAEKLEELARRVSADAEADDHLLFLDGDAFPVAPLAPLFDVAEPLIAARRDGPPIPVPHPCFCLTTVGFWNGIGADWGRGSYHWTASGREWTGQVTDLGANLMIVLRDLGLEWRPLHWMNTRELPTPNAFGVYGDEELGPVVYHHGAGFRSRPNPLADCWIPESVPVLGRAERSIRFRSRRLREGRHARNVIAMIDRDDDLLAYFVG